MAFTTDAGKRWAKQWTGWENYDKFFSQMVRWAMRPAGDQGKFTVATDVKDGKVRVVVTALDKDDEFLNFLNMGGSVVGPDMKPHRSQDAARRRRAATSASSTPRMPAATSCASSPGPGMSPLLTGVNVPYSAEFRDREPNEALLNDAGRHRARRGASRA